MLEVEQKYAIADPQAVIDAATRCGGRLRTGQQSHQDTYFNHPQRDFAQSKEALRIRRIDGTPYLTYKGVKLPGEVKARREIELPIGAAATDYTEAADLLMLLGFVPVATTRKVRRTVEFPEGSMFAGMTIAVDVVQDLGEFVEIECFAATNEEVPAARRRVADLAKRLGLDRPEPRSYLRMMLEKD